MGSQQPAPLGGVDCGAKVFLGRRRVTGPQLGGAGVAQDEQGYHVPPGQPETGERAWVVGDPARGRGERDEIAAGAGVPRLDQIQDDPEAFGARRSGIAGTPCPSTPCGTPYAAACGR